MVGRKDVSEDGKYSKLRAGGAEWGGHGLWVVKMPSSSALRAVDPKEPRPVRVMGWLGSAE